MSPFIHLDDDTKLKSFSSSSKSTGGKVASIVKIEISVSDLISHGMLLRDLESIQRAQQKERKPKKPPLALPYYPEDESR